MPYYKQIKGRMAKNICLAVVFIIFFAQIGLCFDSPASATEQCKPFGVRLALGRHFANESDPNMVSIWFNTQSECTISYVLVEIGASILRRKCENMDPIRISNYTSYSHACYVDSLQRGESFEYLAYGMGVIEQKAIASHSENQRSRLPALDQSIRMVVLADWSFLITKVGIYHRLDASMNYLLENEKIDLLYVNGDIAYDLSSNSGKNYEDFLNMLSQVAVRWPTIMITGNHQRKTATDYKTFINSFELYNMTATNLTSLDLGPVNLIIFDPFQIVLEKSKTDYLYPRFEKEMIRLEEKKKPIISSSHYPLACSGSSTHCKHQRYLLSEFFQSMIDHHSVFYFGSHYHTYERLYPFVGNGDFNLQDKGPYQITKKTKYLLSVVEGISGNDDHIVESYPSFQPFTAAVSYNKTGFGVLEFSSTSLSYSHFLATNPVDPIDCMRADYSSLLQKQSHLRLETE